MEKNVDTLLRKKSTIRKLLFPKSVCEFSIFKLFIQLVWFSCLCVCVGLCGCVCVRVCGSAYVCDMSLCRWTCGFPYLPNACRSTCLQMAQSNFQIVFTITTKSICKYPSNNKCHAHTQTCPSVCCARMCFMSVFLATIMSRKQLNIYGLLHGFRCGPKEPEKKKRFVPRISSDLFPLIKCDF